MFVLFTDETNVQPTARAKFFIYGGLVVPIDALVELHRDIEQIRRDADYRPSDEFKFDTHSRPAYVEREDATEAKRRVIELCLALGCRFIVHVILHDIISGQPLDQQLTWAANCVLSRYNLYLEEVDDHGIVVVDNLPATAQYQYLREKFTCGLVLPTGNTVRLNRVVLLSTSCINASHAASAVDIVLGSFRYCINDPQNVEAAREMMPKVVQMMWHDYDPATDAYDVSGKGLIVRPEYSTIQMPAYRAEYDRLFNHINELLKAERDGRTGEETAANGR
jgi:hypothetical protein